MLGLQTSPPEFEKPRLVLTVPICAGGLKGQVTVHLIRPVLVRAGLGSPEALQKEQRTTMFHVKHLKRYLTYRGWGYPPYLPVTSRGWGRT